MEKGEECHIEFDGHVVEFIATPIVLPAGIQFTVKGLVIGLHRKQLSSSSD